MQNKKLNIYKITLQSSNINKKEREKLLRVSDSKKKEKIKYDNILTNIIKIDTMEVTKNYFCK